MNISFKFNESAKYRVGGVYEPTHQFSLVHQMITIKRGKSFDVRFPNIWQSYKLPLVKEAEIYKTWINNQMQFWQNQLNFAIWCATSGCGVSKTCVRKILSFILLGKKSQYRGRNCGEINSFNSGRCRAFRQIW